MEGTHSLMLEAFIDLGTEENLIDQGLVSKMGSPTLPLTTAMKALTLDGVLIAWVTHVTEPLNLLLSGNH